MANERAERVGDDQQNLTNQKGAQTPQAVATTPIAGSHSLSSPPPLQAEIGKLLVLGQQESAERQPRDINTKINDLERQLRRLSELFSLYRQTIKLRLESLRGGQAKLDSQQHSLSVSAQEYAQELATLKNLTNEKIRSQQAQVESLRGSQANQGEAVRVLDKQMSTLYLRADELGERTNVVSERLDGLDSYTDALFQQINGLAVAGEEQRQATRKGLRTLGIVLAGAVIILAGAITYLQFNPLTIPVAVQDQFDQLTASTQQQANLTGTLAGEIGQLQAKMVEIEAAIAVHGGDMQALHSTLEDVQHNLNDLQSRVKYPDARGELPLLDLHDKHWLAARDKGHYSIQLMGVSSFPYLVDFINQRAAVLANQPVAFGKGLHQGRNWYNLYYGDFATLTQAKAALAALPPTLRSNGPWIRSAGAIKRFIR